MMHISFFLAKALKFFTLTSDIIIIKVLFVNIHNQILSNCSLSSCLQETFKIQIIVIFVLKI